MLESDVDRFKVIDTDTHIIEPYDLWTSRLAVGKWGDKVPHVRSTSSTRRTPGTSASTRIGAARPAAQAGWAQFPPNHPPTPRRGRPGDVGGVGTAQGDGQVRDLGRGALPERRRLRRRQDADDR